MSEQLEVFSCSICDFSSCLIKGFVIHMGIKHKDDIKEDQGTIIGRGEKTLIEILKKQLTGVRIYTQVHLKYLVPQEEVREFSERQIKETIDILIVYNNKWFACRVQHGSTRKYQSKGHLGQVLAQADLVQKNLIQRYHGPHSVIDFRESECKTLFRDKLNWYSESEVGIQCMLEGLQL